MQSSSWQRHIPNAFTLSRVFAVPIIVALLTWDPKIGGYWAAGVFILASFTDYLDGKWARKLGVESVFGQLMDPIADKILVSSTLVMCIPSGRLGTIMVIILLARDTLIAGIRSVAAAENLIIGAGALGKWKTAIQMVAIPAVLIQTPFFGIPIYEIGYWILWISVALSVISGAEYSYKYFRHK